MNALVEGELAACPRELRGEYESRRLPALRKKTLVWEYGQDEPYEAWLLAEMGERNVFIAYCLGGFGSMGSPWGLVFSHSAEFGMDCGWYGSLCELLTDWGFESNA